MEDPWASGSGWGETPKKENPIALPISTSPIRSPPPAASDPWGAPTPETELKSDEMPTFGWHASPTKEDPIAQPTETPGWGGEWEEPSEAGPSRSPIRRPADSPEWSMSPRRDEEDSSRTAMPEIELEQTSPILLAPPIDDPPSPGGFGASSLPPSPKHPTPDLGGFDEPPLAQSPTFGDDFGGFSSFGDDPWGTKKKEEGWGGSSDHESSGTQEAGDIQEEESEAGDGWGGSRSMDRRETKAVTSSGMDQDWEEAQKRIKVTEQRAVSLVSFSLEQKLMY
jgi:hypothetical protein